MEFEEDETSQQKNRIKKPLDIPAFNSQEKQEQDWADDEENNRISQEDG